MKVREYFKHLNNYDEVTFIIAKARKDDNSPFYHPEYVTTPIRHANEWKSMGEYIILNDKQPSITWLSGVNWNFRIKKSYLKSLLVIREEDLELLYPSEEQRISMEKYIETKLF